MQKSLSLKSSLYPEVCLRTIRDQDQCNLRLWKNVNRKFFFFQDIIGPSSQLEWFQGYLSRTNDYMFIVKVANVDIGCMGIRFHKNDWDVYNVILGNMDFSKKGYMTQGFQIMCSFALAHMPKRISAKVLIDNPALRWYCRNGFRIVGTKANHVEIELDLSLFDPCSFIIVP